MKVVTTAECMVPGDLVKYAHGDDVVQPALLVSSTMADRNAYLEHQSLVILTFLTPRGLRILTRALEAEITCWRWVNE